MADTFIIYRCLACNTESSEYIGKWAAVDNYEERGWEECNLIIKVSDKPDIIRVYFEYIGRGGCGVKGQPFHESHREGRSEALPFNSHITLVSSEADAQVYIEQVKKAILFVLRDRGGGRYI